MSPIRIIILGILFYFLFKLLMGNRLWPKNKQKKAGDSNKKPLQDVLVEDPVCRTLVPKSQALPLLMDGEKHYFCSEECRKKFTQQKESKS